MGSAVSLFPVIQLPLIQDERGELVVLEGMRHAPFEIKRVYYMFGVGPGKVRGGHAHEKQRQLAVMVRGSCKVLMDNGEVQESITLRGPNDSLLIEPFIWHSMSHFSTDAILLVAASDIYKESDYYRNYSDFQKMRLKNHALN